MNIISLAEARERGLRIKEARIFAGFKSARAFCERHTDVALSTLKAWESGKHYILTPKGAYLISMALKQHHVEVGIEWLLDGKGLGPTLDGVSSHTAMMDSESLLATLLEQHSEQIPCELNQFLQSSPNAVHYQMPDNSMQPAFAKGDWLCGFWISPDDFGVLNRCYALVEQADGTVVCRYMLDNHNNTVHVQTMRATDPVYINATRLAMITRNYRNVESIVKQPAEI
ncbi:MAG: hypothetical protein P1U34_03230 [Coxiellaceae bacterium]|nr:hypothetical protein [Coxiellaceae bacterium]